jgi:hypothetical protein
MTPDPIESAMNELNESVADLAMVQSEFDRGRTSDWCVGAARERVNRLRETYNRLIVAYGSDE